MSDDSEPTGRPALSARARGLCREFGSAAPLLLWAVGGPLLGLLVLGATSASWLPMCDDGPGSLFAFLVIGSLMAALCLVPTHMTSLLAGYLFGTWAGALSGFLVVFFAAILGFAGFSRIVGDRVMESVGAMPRAATVHRALFGRSTGRTIWLITLLRLSPVMPFAATNLLMASFRVRAWVFLCATILGVSPRSIGVAMVGAQLSDLDWSAGGSVWSTIVAIASTLLVVWLIGRYARAALRRETASHVEGEVA